MIISGRSANECVTTAIHRVEKLTADGICESCALRLTAKELNIAYARLRTLYLDR